MMVSTSNDGYNCSNIIMCNHEIRFGEFLARFCSPYRLKHLMCKKCNHELYLPQKYATISIMLDILCIITHASVSALLITYFKLDMNIVAKLAINTSIILVLYVLLKYLYFLFLNKTGKWKEVKNDNDSNNN